MAYAKYLIGPERRPCYVNGKKAIFHQWINKAQIAPPSMMIGGHMGGQLWDVFGLVELEDGSMKEVYPTDVVFADGGDFVDTAFRPQKEEKNIDVERVSGFGTEDEQQGAGRERTSFQRRAGADRRSRRMRRPP